MLGSRVAAEERLVQGSRRLLAAEAAARVGHHVCVFVVGCDRVPAGYMRAKLAQEREVERGPVPWTIVRATQFHEAVAGLLASVAPWRVLPVPLPGGMGRALRGGMLTDRQPDVRSTTRFAAWLAAATP